MSASFDLDPVDRITAGAVGEPGERVFFVQARRDAAQITLLAEKEQVRLLSQALLQLLAQLPDAEEGEGPDLVDLELSEPLDPMWRVGEMSIEYDDDLDRITVVIREAVPQDENGEPETEPAVARFGVSRAQARAMAEHSLEVVSSGRPRCRLCGEPLNEGEEHVCPAMNGHRGPRAEG